MAIFHLSTTPLSRSNGRSAVAAAAYRSGSELVDSRTGQVFDYTRKGGVLSSEIVTPEGVPIPEREVLWNAAEAAERRKDSRIAREWRAALPVELDAEQRYTVAHRWAKEYADRYGVAVDVCIHQPDAGGDERNFHVHMLVTTRQIDRNGELGAKAAIELGNKDRTKAGIQGTTQAEMVDLRARWAEITNEELERGGMASRIDHRSYAARGIDLTPTTHVGVSAVGMDRRGLDADRVRVLEDIRADNARKIDENPSIILDKITYTRAVFDRRDMARELNSYIDDPDQFQSILARLEQDKQLVMLAPERTEGMRIIPAKYSTREMIETERRMVEAAGHMADANTPACNEKCVQAAIEKRGTLSEEQRAAVEQVTGSGRLAVVIGDAGTGKSFAMATAREAWEAQGYRVRGAALAGKAAEGLQEGSGIESRTLHSLEYGWDQGKDELTCRDVLVIDEAGMVGSRQLGRVLERADKAGAKVVMLGDDKQLSAIEAGAGFRAITDRVGATEITEIRRQHDEWARKASSEFARGDVRAATDAYNERGLVRMLASRDDAKAAIASDYLTDRSQGGSSIILAHSNKDVFGLNQSIREARQEAGELGPSMTVETSRGSREFAAGDRLMFRKNDRNLDVKNGTLGTVQATDDGMLSVKLDSGRDVAFDPATYQEFDHGYAATVHKSQGVTVDRAYMLATPGMDRSLAYVGMTRHRESATMYAGGDDFASYDKLVNNLSRERPKESTLDFAERHGVETGREQTTEIEAKGNEKTEPVAEATEPAEAAQNKAADVEAKGEPKAAQPPQAEGEQVQPEAVDEQSAKVDQVEPEQARPDGPEQTKSLDLDRDRFAEVPNTLATDSEGVSHAPSAEAGQEFESTPDTEAQEQATAEQERASEAAPEIEAEDGEQAESAPEATEHAEASQDKAADVEVSGEPETTQWPQAEGEEAQPEPVAEQPAEVDQVEPQQARPDGPEQTKSLDLDRDRFAEVPNTLATDSEGVSHVPSPEAGQKIESEAEAGAERDRYAPFSEADHEAGSTQDEADTPAETESEQAGEEVREIEAEGNEKAEPVPEATDPAEASQDEAADVEAKGEPEAAQPPQAEGEQVQPETVDEQSAEVDQVEPQQAQPDGPEQTKNLDLDRDRFAEVPNTLATDSERDRYAPFSGADQETESEQARPETEAEQLPSAPEDAPVEQAAERSQDEAEATATPDPEQTSEAAPEIEAEDGEQAEPAPEAKDPAEASQDKAADVEAKGEPEAAQEPQAEDEQVQPEAEAEQPAEADQVVPEQTRDSTNSSSEQMSAIDRMRQQAAERGDLNMEKPQAEQAQSDSQPGNEQMSAIDRMRQQAAERGDLNMEKPQAEQAQGDSQPSSEQMSAIDRMRQQAAERGDLNMGKPQTGQAQEGNQAEKGEQEAEAGSEGPEQQQDDGGMEL